MFMLYVHEKPAHALAPKDVLSHLKASETTGLTHHEAKLRLSKNGPNALKEGAHITPLQIFARQFESAIVWILAFAAVVSLYLGEIIEAYAISVIILVTCIIGFFQEYKAENIMQSIKKLTTTNVRVLRDKKIFEIPSREVVVGDTIYLESGDKVPVDARIITSNRFSVDESALTGESVPVKKEERTLAEGTPLADRKNMVFMGCYVSTGNAIAVVTHTGMTTEMGRIAGTIPKEAAMTPLQTGINGFGKKLSLFVILISISVIAVELLKGKSLYDILLISIAIAVSGVPESLPIIITIGLSHGIYMMAKKNALVRKMDAVETLGCVTVICSDKTGTLTKNEMTVTKMYANGSVIDVLGRGYNPEGGGFLSDGKKIAPKNNPALGRMIVAGMLCNNAKISNEGNSWSCIGDTTEGSLIVLGKKAGLSEEIASFDYMRIAEMPFDSGRKCMSTVHKRNNDAYLFSKGAPGIILAKCTHVEKNGKSIPLSSKEKKEILAAYDSFSKESLRVLALAYKQTRIKEYFDERDECGMTFLGLAGIEDPPREGVKESIAACSAAGIKVVMITGDHAATAEAVAKEIGLIKGIRLVLDCTELDKMPDDEFLRVVERIRVYARATPEHKLRIIDALQKRGHVVAMTGDGVNDAIALKKAHVGISMGQRGTDVAKESSDISLLDDNFNTIAFAVKEGRTIYRNLQRAMQFVLSVTFAEMGVIILAVLLDFPLPLTALMVLFINLVTDDFPAMGMSTDRAERNVMRERPRKTGDSLISRQTFNSIILSGTLMTLATFGVFAMYHIYFGVSMVRSQTAAFAALMAMEILYAYVIRMPEDTRRWQDIFSNKYLNATVALSALAAIFAIHLPEMQGVFYTTALTPYDWLAVLTAGAIAVACIAVLTRSGRHLEKELLAIRNKIVLG